MSTTYTKRKKRLEGRIERKMYRYYDALNANKRAKELTEMGVATNPPFDAGALAEIKLACEMEIETLLPLFEKGIKQTPPPRKPRGKKLSKAALAESLREVA